MATNFRELIKKAIAIEEKLAEFYGDMAMKAATPIVRDIFKILADDEKEHRALLEAHEKQGIFPRLPQVKEADLEPTLQIVASITSDTTLIDALAFAIKSEEYQHKFYKKLALEYPPGLTRKFLEIMAVMEFVHKERVEVLHHWFSRVQG
jgi:rubrerythrin